MLKRIAIILCLSILAIAIVTSGYIALIKPSKQAASDEAIEITSERVERGRYLAENIVLCSDCHSERDWQYFGGPRKEPIGIGRECITAQTPVAGIITSEDDDLGVSPARNTGIDNLCIPNITPHKVAGIGNWSDGEIIRAIREGIDHDGQGLFPIMPYFIFRDIADEDVKAIVAYLRSLTPINKPRSEKAIQFPLSLLMKLWPEPVHDAVPMPDRNNDVEYGKYLANIGRCYFCHTPRSRFGRQSIEELKFSGGVTFAINDLVLYSNNLSPDEKTGIGDWSREKFIAHFKKHSVKQMVPANENTLMNWHAYAGMSEQDIGAIYAYLRTVPAINNEKRDRESRATAF